MTNTKEDLRAIKKRIRFVGIFLISVLVILTVNLGVQMLNPKLPPSFDQPIIATQSIISEPEPTISEEIFYTEAPHPCFMGYEIGFVHTWFDENWVCDRCKEYVGPRYGFTDEEVYLLAQLLCGSADYDGDGEYDFVWDAVVGNDIRYDQISLVLCVVMNRVRSDERYFPDTVIEVVMQKRQFAVMPRNANKTPHEMAIKYVKEWCDAYDRWDGGVQSIPEDHLYFTEGPNLTNISSTTWR